MQLILISALLIVYWDLLISWPFAYLDSRLIERFGNLVNRFLSKLELLVDAINSFAGAFNCLSLTSEINLIPYTNYPLVEGYHDATFLL